MDEISRDVEHQLRCWKSKTKLEFLLFLLPKFYLNNHKSDLSSDLNSSNWSTHDVFKSYPFYLDKKNLLLQGTFVHRLQGKLSDKG